MTVKRAISSPRIYDGSAWHENAVLLVNGDRCVGIASAGAAPADFEIVEAAGAMLVPGFVDLQVNGGGGVLFNERPNVRGIKAICSAHARFGTTALLPTLITDDTDVTRRALKAGFEAHRTGVSGFLGLHLEGPHLSKAKRGAHSEDLIRAMTERDLKRLIDARTRLPVLVTTTAPENTKLKQVEKLAAAGVSVSVGHSDCDYATAMEYFAAGASMVTHLFNAMSPLAHREPGLVGAALYSGEIYAGIIADGFHVHPAAFGAALRAKKGPGRIFVVTDAMSTIGTELKSLTLNGRHICRENGRLTLEDGTLAGADIDMASSVRFLKVEIGLPLEEALAMASQYPAEAVGVADRKGKLEPGFDADFTELNADLQVQKTWIGGTAVFEAA
ncbi:N-acetylglucosamine-6-phosphate deacetylase [Hoeflea sp. WL0058]|uniref:N-acetylglucosamine-6-phosphate deacetylase n=1 Tax=Flavimaribacter sediminis TaxID=2865987 RepID=A0AAE2ZT27_9HYPH|nr:N-acetylglucosamine-6-phosphate deacetylase [Flavimaribacter sediminis]MBW8640165.1 N-acetylglucosamine-6-phosphate deacetylase [Flavimaribacter sediminis]